jgi:hypothetical protein
MGKDICYTKTAVFLLDVSIKSASDFSCSASSTASSASPASPITAPTLSTSSSSKTALIKPAPGI